MYHKKDCVDFLNPNVESIFPRAHVKGHVNAQEFEDTFQRFPNHVKFVAFHTQFPQSYKRLLPNKKIIIPNKCDTIRFEK